MPDQYAIPLDDLLKLLVQHEGSDLHLRADEFVRLRLTATAGGALGPVDLVAKFDLGGHPADTHRLA